MKHLFLLQLSSILKIKLKKFLVSKAASWKYVHDEILN